MPISAAQAADIRAWADEIGGAGRVLRALGRGNRLTSSLGPVSLFRLVQRYGKQMDKPDLAPHDLRRTYPQLGYEAGIPLTQISTLLGHANLRTTVRYLDLALAMKTTVSGFVPYKRSDNGRVVPQTPAPTGADQEQSAI